MYGINTCFSSKIWAHDRGWRSKPMDGNKDIIRVGNRFQLIHDILGSKPEYRASDDCIRCFHISLAHAIANWIRCKILSCILKIMHFSADDGSD